MDSSTIIDVTSKIDFALFHLSHSLTERAHLFVFPVIFVIITVVVINSFILFTFPSLVMGQSYYISTLSMKNMSMLTHDNVIKWKHFLRHGPFARGIHRFVPSQKPVTQSYDIFLDLRLKKRLSHQSKRRWFETPSRSLWRHCNVTNRSNAHERVHPLHIVWDIEYNTVITRIPPSNPHQKHHIACRLGRDRVCILWVSTLIYILPQSLQWCMQYHVLLGNLCSLLVIISRHKEYSPSSTNCL